MKSHSIVLLAAVSLAVTSHGEGLQRPPMRKAPTNEELILQLRQNEKEMAAAPKSRSLSTTVDPSVTYQPKDFISSSEILCYNGALTFVPKRAVLQFPKNLADRLKAQPGARVQNWPAFYAANRGWITTVEVSKIQAQGRQPLSEETAVHITKCGKLVVATFQGNPISVHPVPATDVPATAAANTPTASKP
jgi:hypothetical protein